MNKIIDGIIETLAELFNARVDDGYWADYAEYSLTMQAPVPPGADEGQVEKSVAHAVDGVEGNVYRTSVSVQMLSDYCVVFVTVSN